MGGSIVIMNNLLSVWKKSLYDRQTKNTIYIIIFNGKVFPSWVKVERKFFLQTSNSAEIEIETLLNSFFLDKMLYFSTWSILQL